MTREEKKNVFKKWAYGLFIHYGLYSTYGLGEWVMFQERRDVREYYRDALPNFQPRKGCAREWIELAKRCGMNYAVLTTRHHEGFFIGDELIREFVTTCRENNMGVGLYYSVADWSDPDYCGGPRGAGWERFVQKSHRQVREIMSNYGKIDYLFYDGCPPADAWRLHELHREIRAIQPELLISRCFEDVDLQSCEGHANGAADRLWESCYTLNDSWGYNKFDTNWKSPAEVVTMLSNNRHNGGNLLLNVSPMADGTIQPEAVKIIETAGAWIRRNAEALYDVTPHPFHYFDREISTAHGKNAYIRLLCEYRGSERRICGIGNRVKAITFLGTGEKLDFVQKEDVITLTGLVPAPQGSMPRIIKLELDGEPVGIRNVMQPDYTIKFTGD